jgi:hypothetical protein
MLCRIKFEMWPFENRHPLQTPQELFKGLCIVSYVVHYSTRIYFIGVQMSLVGKGPTTC